MINAFKKLVYFSEIFPKKYWCEFIVKGSASNMNISIMSDGKIKK